MVHLKNYLKILIALNHSQKKDIDLSPEEYTLICNIQKFVKLCKCKYIDKDTIVAECDKNGVKL